MILIRARRFKIQYGHVMLIGFSCFLCSAVLCSFAEAARESASKRQTEAKRPRSSENEQKERKESDIREYRNAFETREPEGGGRLAFLVWSSSLYTSVLACRHGHLDNRLVSFFALKRF